MNSKVFIYTLVVAVVVIGGWVLFNKPSSLKDAVGLVIKDAKISGEYALKNIIALDESFKCQFEKEDGDLKVTGIISMAPGAKVRGDFNIISSANSASFETHFIMRAGLIYTWTSLLDAGFIAPATLDSSGQAGVVAMDEKIKYDCERFTPTQGEFELPADITFTNAKQ